MAGRLAAAIVALLAMAPVGFFYAASGLLVPGPWLFLMWLLYLALLWLAVWLARRGSYPCSRCPSSRRSPGGRSSARRGVGGWTG